MLLIEILAVVAAFITLIYCGAMMGKSAMRFGKTTNRFMKGVNPKTAHIMDQAGTAQRLAFSIMEGRDRLLGRIPRLLVDIARLKVLITAARNAWKPVSRVLRYVGL